MPFPRISLGMLAPDFQIVESNVGTGVGGIQLVKADPRRWSIFFSLTTANDVFLGLGNRAPATTGFRLNVNTSYVLFNYHDHAISVQQSWFGWTIASTANIYVLEVLYIPVGGNDVES